MLPVEQPFKTYTGLDGKPLDNGYVYFGLPDQDPITHPVAVYWDAAGTLPAAQPLRTVGGYIMNAGTPANLFFDGAYSELVQDKKRQQVFYARTSEEFSIGALVLGLAKAFGSSLIGFIQSGVGAAQRTVQDKLYESISAFDFMTPAERADVSSGAGALDVTKAVKAAFAAGANLFPPGVYKITATEVDPIIIGGSRRWIDGAGAIFLSTVPSSIGTVKITGQRITLNDFCFDGSNLALNVLQIGDTAKRITLNSPEVRNCRQQPGDAPYAVGIMVQCGSEQVTINDPHVHDIDAPVTGIARGILATSYGTTATALKKLVINGGLIENITPFADGDGIVFQPLDVTADLDSSINNVRFLNCAKRGVKIMGSGVRVNGGEITLPVANGYAGVSVYGSRCAVVGTKITGGYAEHGVDIGSSAYSCSNILIDGVTVAMTSQATNDGVRVYGSAAHPTNDVTITKCDLSTLRHGVHLNNAGSRAIVSSNNIRNTTQNGVYLDGPGGAVYMSQVTVAFNNFAAITGYTVRNEGAIGWNAIFSNSDGSGSGANASLPQRGNVFGNLIAGQTAQACGAAAPTAGTWVKGDFVWNTNPNTYGAVGWLCIASGTPGTWQPVRSGCEKAGSGSRPTKAIMGVANDSDWRGTMYFDMTLGPINGKPIWWNGSVWVDATGAAV